MLRSGPADGRVVGTLFRILVVDDNPANVHLLQQKGLSSIAHPFQLDWVKDGSEALDFLFRRDSHANAPRPDLVLMDINMPILNGLEALRVIKGDAELRLIPVIMFSTSAEPDEVWQSYHAYANCYVQKPASLECLVKLIGAIESFWMDFAILPGRSVARQTAEGQKQCDDS
jgi:chemotaxis family two-component system response regulator Rcp1